VRGPTLSERISRSQSMRCASVSLVVAEVLMSTLPPWGGSVAQERVMDKISHSVWDWLL
jgi:hypothetical protein